jgi:hypothetical protein
MEHRSKADLSILARDPFGKANFGVLARHAAPEPAVNAPLLAKKEAIPPMMRARDRYGIDETAQRLRLPQTKPREHKDIVGHHDKLTKFTATEDQYAHTLQRPQQQYVNKLFSMSTAAQREFFAKEILAYGFRSAKDSGVDGFLHPSDDLSPESFAEMSDPADQDAGRSEYETKELGTVKLHGSAQNLPGTKVRHASQRTADDSLEARASFTVKKHADGVPYLARRDAAKTALESAAVIMNSKAPQAPAESDECGMYITHTISEDRTGTADEVMTKRLLALTASRYRTRKKKKSRRKIAWGTEDSEGSVDDDPSTINPETGIDEVKISPFQCDKCLQICHGERELGRHRRLMHSDPGPFPCGRIGCMETFATEGELKV